MTSAVATPAEVRTRTRALAIHPDLLAAGAAALFALVVLAVTWGTWGNLNGDTGYDAVAGARLADGEVPYVDYIYYYGPLGPALAGLAALAGDGFGPQIALGFVITGLILAGTYLLARLHAGPLGAFLATALVTAVAFTPDNFSYVLPHTLAATLGTLALLAFLLAQAGATRRGGTGWLVAAGAAAGLATLTKPEYAFAAFAAVAAWLLVRRSRTATPWRDAVLVAAPMAAIPVVVYGLLAAGAGLRDLVFENLYPVDTLEAGGDEILQARMPMTPSSIAELGARTVMYAAGIAALLVVAWLIARGGRARVAGIVLAVLGGLGALGVAVLNGEALRHGLQFTYGWIPLGAVLAVAWIVYRQRGRESRWDGVSQETLAGAVVLAVLAATTYNGFFLHATHSQTAVYYAPFAAAFLVRLHLVELARSRPALLLGAAWIGFLVVAGTSLALRDASDDTQTVRGPGGSIAAPAENAAALQAAVDAITANSAPGDTMLAAPFLTSLYVLADREDPFSAIVVQPGTFPAVADERAAIAELERADVRVAVTSRRELPGYGATSFGGSFDAEIAAWIRTHFNHVQTLSGSGSEPLVLDVWTRR